MQRMVGNCKTTAATASEMKIHGIALVLVCAAALASLKACRMAPESTASVGGVTTNTNANLVVAPVAEATNQPVQVAFGHAGAVEPQAAAGSGPLDVIGLPGDTARFRPGSLAWNIWTDVLSRTNLADKNIGSQRIVWDPKGRRWVHNTNFYLGGFRGWSAYSIWNDADTNLYPRMTNHSFGGGTTYQGGGIAVSPEHILSAGHMGFRSNWWVVFLDTNNVPVFRRIADYFNGNRTNFPYVYDPPNGTSNMWAAAPRFDYYVALLDSPLPASVEIIKIVPPNWWTKFDALFYSTNAQFRVPLLVFNCQHRQPWVNDLTSLGMYMPKPGNTNRYGESATQLDALNHVLKGWGCGRVMGGDSGSPFFMLLDGDCCLFGCIGSSIVFGNMWDLSVNDSLWSNMVSCINATMRELSARNGRTNFYTLQIKDLSRYPSYRKSMFFGQP